MGNLIIFTYFDQKRSEEIFFVPFCLCLLSDILQKIQEFLFCQSIFALKKLPQKLCKNFICLVRCQILYQAYHDLILTVFRIDILLDQFYEILLYVIRISRVLCFAAEHFPEYRCSIFCPVSCYISCSLDLLSAKFCFRLSFSPNIRLNISGVFAFS